MSEISSLNRNFPEKINKKLNSFNIKALIEDYKNMKKSIFVLINNFKISRPNYFQYLHLIISNNPT